MKGKIEKSNVHEIFELSSIQKGMLYHFLKDSDENLYNVQLSFSLEGDLNVETLKKAFNLLQSNNEVLRSVFRWDVSKPLQIILNECHLNIQFYDLSQHSTDEEILLAKKYLDQDWQARFDLSELPFRVLIMKLAERSFILTITYHHILYDGWSNGILLKELLQYYNELSQARTPKLNKKRNLKTIYLAQRQKIDANNEALYWGKYLNGCRTSTLILKDHATVTGKGEIKKNLFIIPSKVSNELKVFVSENRITKAAVIYAAYGILLSKYLNSSDVVFGTTVSNRDMSITGMDKVIGTFINTIPLRVAALNGKTLREVVIDVHKDVIERNQFNNTSYADIKELLALKSGESLYDSVIAIENYPLDEQSVGRTKDFGIGLKSVRENTSIPLVLSVFLKEKVEIEFMYKQSFINDVYAESVANNLISIIGEIVSSCQKTINEIKLSLSQPEVICLHEFNNTTTQFPKDETVISLFEKSVVENPDKVAFAFRNHTVTYAELKEKSDKIASFLREVKNIWDGDLVGLMMERDEHLIPFIIGVLKTGAAFVPIDLAYPTLRKKAIIEDSKLKLLISKQSMKDIVACDCLDVESLHEILTYKATPWTSTVDKQNLVYVLFTSGSTGKPKGVMIEHRSLTNYINWAAKTYIGNEDAIFPLYTSISFDLTVTSIFVPLISGNKIIIYDESDKGLVVEKVMANKDVNVIKLTPSHLKIVRDSDNVQIPPEGEIKTLIVGGEELSLQLALDVYHKFKGRVKIYNEYGPTEATVGCMIYAFDSTESLSSVPLGVPINNTQIYILDEALQHVPAGVEGEIYIAGDGLASGYLNNETFTKQRFVANPFNPGTRMYKTGDLAVRSLTGKILFKGRIDDQVKINGFRTELTEIETQLRLYPDIKEALVVPNEKDNIKFLVAYYVSNNKIGSKELENFLSTTLAEYMVPQYFVQIPSIPLTTNGKADKKALPKPVLTTSDEFEAPTTVFQEKLVEIWSAILKLEKEKISINKSFLEFGGHSLKVILMLNKVLKEFNVVIPINDFFNNENIKKLGQHIQALEKSRFLTIEKSPAKKYYKLSSAQKRLYFLQEFDTSSTAYNGGLITLIKGKIDKERIEKSFQKLISHYEILRTYFVLEENEVVQKISDDILFKIDLQLSSTESIQAAQRNFIKPFDLQKAPLIRVGLIEVSAEEHILIVDTHHIIGDGVSQEILINNFISIYSGQELPQPRLQYKDYSEWQHGDEYLKKNPIQKKFWMQEFSSLPEILELPADFPRQTINHHCGGTISFSINGEYTAGLKSIAENEKVTLFMLILAIYNILLSKLSNSEDIVIGTPVAGRNHPDIENMIGMFVNTIPLRNRVNGDLNFKEFLLSVKSKTLNCFDNQNYPYEELIDALEIGRSTNRNPLFDTMFVYEDFMETELKLPELKLETLTSESTVSKLDMALVVHPKGEQMYCTIEYSTELFRRETIEDFTEYFRRIVSAVCSNSAIKLADIELVSNEEKNKLLIEFNDTSVHLKTDETFVSLFEKNVLKNPDRTAVIHGKERLTYSEVNRRANVIAFEIGKRIPAERAGVVGLLFNSSTEMITSILGVLKSGNAFLPLSPDSPWERNSYIISDCCAALLLTQEEIVGKDNAQWAALTDTIIIKKDLFSHNIPANYSRNIAGRDLAYIIYTSGTTGRPKGVKITHKNLLNYAAWSASYHKLNFSDVTLQLVHYHFDGFGANFYPALLSGGTITTIQDNQKLNTHHIASVIRNEKVTNFAVLPAMYAQLLNEINNAGDFKDLRFVVLAGEQASANLLEKSAQILPHVRLGNEYGPTEATIAATHNNTLTKINASIIGKPIWNTSVYILGRNSEIMPVGLKGEICIAGNGIAEGYVGSEALTNEKFVANPFVKGNKMYRTGDMGRWLVDGSIEISGRRDDQLKIRGYRIETAEIEAQLCLCDKISEAIVLAKESQNDKYLVAYYVSPEQIEYAKLRTFLLERLPDYMVPSYFAHLTALPRTAIGKLDRKALLKVEVETVRNYDPPITVEQRSLADVWSKVLGVKMVSISDNFFSIGGDSIKSIQISARMRTAGYDLPVKDIFINQTIKDLAPKLKKLTTISDQSQVVGIVPLTPIQKWFFESPISRKHHFNQSVMLDFPDVISKEVVERVFKKLTVHHDVLRMVFKRDGNKIIQENLNAEFTISVDVFDLIEVDNLKGEILAVSNTLQSSFDLEKGQLVKLGLFQSPNRSRLLIIIHHLVIDTVSWRILFEDIENLLQQAKNNEPLSLPLKTDSYLKWSSALSHYLKSKKFAIAEKYWQERLKNISAPIKRDYLSGANDTENTDYSFLLSKKETLSLLTSVSRPFNSQINDILLSGLLLAVKRQFGNDTMWVDMEGHGRDDLNNSVNISRTVGWFTSMYPVFLEYKMDSLSDLIKCVKEALREVPNNGLDYLMQQHRDTLSTRSQIIFNYLGQFDSDIKGKSYVISNESKGDNISSREARIYDWEIASIISHGQLTITLTYSKNQYKDKTIESFMSQYNECLLEIIEYCDNYERVELTPSDLTYKALTIDQLNSLQKKYSLANVCPLSPMQESLLFHTMLNQVSDSYFEQMAIRIQGDLNMDAIQKTMNDLVARYDILRTVFLSNGYARPIQVVLKERDVIVNYSDIQAECLEHSPKEVIKSYYQNDRRTKFDLREDVLIRLSVCKAGSNDYYFVWSHHHIIMDGWCMGIIFRDFKALYAKNRIGEDVVLPPVKPYSHYIAWLADVNLVESTHYWENYLSVYNTLATLPKKQILTNENILYDHAQHEISINKEETRLLHKVSSEYGVTINTILQTIWGLLLMRYNNVQDVVFGSVVSGRPSQLEGIEDMVGLFINTVPVRIKWEYDDIFSDLLQKVQLNSLASEQYCYQPLSEIQSLSELGRDLLDHIIIFENYPIENVLEKARPGNGNDDFSILEIEAIERIDYNLWIAVIPGEDVRIKFSYNKNVYAEDVILRVANHFGQLVRQILSDNRIRISDLTMITSEEKDEILNRFNNTAGSYSSEETLVSLFQKQAFKTPQKIAVVYEDRVLFYSELHEKSDALAKHLRERFDIKPDDFIAMMMDRSDDMVLSLLAILKAGAAYVPIDPMYPRERIEYILEDSGARVLLINDDLPQPLNYTHEVFYLNRFEYNACKDFSYVNKPTDLCYLIYTSGSTGRPKGVMISHRNVVNFFAGMNNQLQPKDTDCLLAITSTSFDISVLELFWTLCNGIEVVIHPSEFSMAGLDRYLPDDNSEIDFSLFFFSSYNNRDKDKYRLLRESAKYADVNGFSAVWTPERHFHEFGGLYPNPSVTSSALAMITNRLELRCGSIVSPLHDVVRIAEEWSVVDNLSKGRVSLSFASGWNPNDFALAPENYKERHTIMYQQIEEVRRLWRGESICRENGFGQKVELRVFPEPVQKELPVWITAAKSEETFISAGAIGANVLTHFLGQDINELERKITLYRESREKNGYASDTGKVAVMLHTYIGVDIDEVITVVEKPFTEYLESSIGLGKILLEEAGLKEEDLSEENKKAILKSAFKRYYETSSLMGTKSSCSKLVRSLKKIGVNEIACLIDFGVGENKVLEGLQNLKSLKEMFSKVKKHHSRPVTMLQSTPSFMKMLEEDDRSNKFLKSLRMLLIGGESVHASLIRRIKSISKAEIFNMYGPTETTIWSCVYKFDTDSEKISIGKPILNTEIYILDKKMNILPIGVAGDLYIGGEGVSRGYWNRQELTEERFRTNPFKKNSRIYKTGDIAKWLSDGNIEMIGREDDQVKIRGYRIELGEIETHLRKFSKISDAVVSAKEKDGIKYLTGYLVSESPLDFNAIRKYLMESLPDYMIPTYFVQLDQFPLTPNGKINRALLPAPIVSVGDQHKGASNAIEEKLVEIWSGILKIDKESISVNTSFFEIGGHSLNATTVVNNIHKEFNVEMPLQKIFVTNTVEQIADYIENERWVKEEIQDPILQGDEVILN